MDVLKNPHYLRRAAGQVDEFRQAFNALLRLCQFTRRPPLPTDTPPDVFETWLSIPAVVPHMHISDEAWVAAKARVSRAAGKVAHLPEITGVMVDMPGRGLLNPFEMWITITQPRSALQPDDVLLACEHTLGRLEGMAEQAEVAASADISIQAMHPLVWGAARGQWRSELYRDAVAAAVGAVIDLVRQRTGRSELDESDVLAQAFSSDPPQPGRPRLRWPGNQQDQTARSMNRGLLHFSLGVQSAIRNPAIHDRTDLTAQEGAERLAAVSLLAGLIERCERVEEVDASSLDRPV